MLGSIVLFACALAGLAAAGILFVLYGPVPVNRRVNRLSRLVPADAFVAPAMPAAPAQPVFSSPHELLASGNVQTTREPDFDRPAPKADGTPAPIPLTVEKRRAVAAVEPVAPLRLRRPGNPPPLPPRRAARGSEAPPATFEVEHTAHDTAPFPHVATQAQTSPFELASSSRTASFQYEDATFAEPGARVRRRR